MGGDFFKSGVYHLFHGHETKRTNDRFPTFHKHKNLDRQGWITELLEHHNWGAVEGEELPIVNETLLYALNNGEKPLLTVCIVNYKRYDILINTLRQYISIGANINLILWINDCDSMPESIKETVLTLSEKFYMSDVMWCRKNMGTGYPRFMMLNKAYYEYDTPYIMTSDDDIMFDDSDSVFMGCSILHQSRFKEYGAIGIWCSPIYFIIQKDEKGLSKVRPGVGFHNTQTLGAATMTIRREVLEGANTDPGYTIGLVDWDFSQSIVKAGWKLGLLCDERFKPENVGGSKDNAEYTKGRWDKSVIEKSYERYKKKWNLDIKTL